MRITIFGNTDKPVITQQQLAATSADDDTLNVIRSWIIGGWPDRKHITSEVNPINVLLSETRAHRAR